MVKYFVPLCLVMMSGTVSAGDPGDLFKSQIVAKLDTDVTKLRVWKDKIAVAAGYFHGITTIDLASNKVGFRKADISLTDVVLAERKSKPVIICAVKELNEDLEEGTEGTVRCLDAKTGETTFVWRRLSSYVTRVSVSADGEKIGVIASTLGPTILFPRRVLVNEVCLLDEKAAAPSVMLRGRYEELRFSPSADSMVLVDSSNDGMAGFGIVQRRRNVFEMSVASRKERHMFGLDPYSAYCNSQDGNLVVVTTEGKRQSIDVWDQTTGKRVASIPEDDVTFSAVAVSPSSKLLAYADRHGVFELWKLGDVSRYLTFKHSSPIISVCFLDDSSWLCLDSQGTITRYQLR